MHPIVRSAAFFDLNFQSESLDNDAGYRDDELDAILAAARRELDTARRAEHNADAHHLRLDDTAVIPVYHDIAVTHYTLAIAGVEVTAIEIHRLEGIERSA